MCLRPALCHDRPRGTTLWSDGTDVCLLPGGSVGAGPDVDARVVHVLLQELQTGGGKFYRPRVEVRAIWRNSSFVSDFRKPPVW